MKSKNLFSELANRKILLVLPAIFIFLFIVNACKESSTSEPKEVISQPASLPAISTPPVTESLSPDSEEVFVLVDELPTFKGGDTEMMNFINKNIVYPETAMTNGIQGQVFLQFCVTDKGKVTQAKVLRGVDPALDSEALRVVNLMPDWNPGKLDGKEVNVWFQLPLTFQLK